MSNEAKNGIPEVGLVQPEGPTHDIEFIKTLEKPLKALTNSRIVKLGRVLKCVHRCYRPYISCKRDGPDKIQRVIARFGFGHHHVLCKSKYNLYDHENRNRYTSSLEIISDARLETTIFREFYHNLYDFPTHRDITVGRNRIRFKDSSLEWYNVGFQNGHSRNTGPSFICNRRVIWRNVDNNYNGSIFLSNEDEYPTKIKDILYCNYLFLFNEYEKMRLYINMINNDKTYHEKTKNYIHITHSRTNAQRDVITQIKKMKIIDMRWRQPSE